MQTVITTLIKTIDEIRDCRIYGIIGNNRYLIATSNAKIEIYKKEISLNGNRIKKYYASLIICNDIIARMELDDKKLLNILKFEISIELYGKNEIYNKIQFNQLSGIEVEDDIWTFEILDNNLIIRLRDEF